MLRFTATWQQAEGKSGRNKNQLTSSAKKYKAKMPMNLVITLCQGWIYKQVKGGKSKIVKVSLLVGVHT
jgi:hypothetical protein